MEGMIGEIFFGGLTQAEMDGAWQAFLRGDAQKTDTDTQSRQTGDAFEFDFSGVAPRPLPEDGEIVLKAHSLAAEPEPVPSYELEFDLMSGGFALMGVEPVEIDVL